LGSSLEVVFESIVNARDLGNLRTYSGRKTVPGLIFRSGALGGISDSDLEQISNDLRISVVIDLRTAEEAGGDGREDRHLLPDEIETFHLSIVPEGMIGREPFPDGSDPVRLAEGYFTNVIEAEGRIAEIIRLISERLIAGDRVLFHCAAGRDRTGVIAAIILGLVGVTREEITADFLLSNRDVYGIARKLYENPLYMTSGSRSMEPVALHGKTMEHFLDLFQDRFGGPLAWAVERGIDRDLIQALGGLLIS
jgi:protein-tyrosine phosphatase